MAERRGEYTQGPVSARSACRRKILSSDLLPSIKSGHAHAHLWLLDRLLKEIDQLVHNTLRRIDRGDHERIRIHRTQVKIISKVADPLSKKTRCALPLPSRNGCSILIV